MIICEQSRVLSFLVQVFLMDVNHIYYVFHVINGNSSLHISPVILNIFQEKNAYSLVNSIYFIVMAIFR